MEPSEELLTKKSLITLGQEALPLALISLNDEG